MARTCAVPAREPPKSLSNSNSNSKSKSCTSHSSQTTQSSVCEVSPSQRYTRSSSKVNGSSSLHKNNQLASKSKISSSHKDTPMLSTSNDLSNGSSSGSSTRKSTPSTAKANSTPNGSSTSSIRAKTQRNLKQKLEDTKAEKKKKLQQEKREAKAKKAQKAKEDKKTAALNKSIRESSREARMEQVSRVISQRVNTQNVASPQIRMSRESRESLTAGNQNIRLRRSNSLDRHAVSPYIVEIESNNDDILDDFNADATFDSTEDLELIGILTNRRDSN